MSKAEVVGYLGKSKRTVETFVSKGRLGVSYFEGPNGKTAIFQRSEVEALKIDIDTPTYRATPETATSRQGFAYLGAAPSGAAALLTGPSGDPLAFLAAALARMAPQPAPVVKPWLTLSEAVDYSGLPATYLVQQARARKMRAVNVGTGERAFWRFNREGLTK